MLRRFLAVATNPMPLGDLFSGVAGDLLQAEGDISPGTLTQIDRLLASDAVGKIGSWEMPDGLPAGSIPDDRWRAASSLQKATRRGESVLAMAAAHAAHDIDERYLFRRLATIAIEDVFLGNLYAVAVTLALAGNKAARDRVGSKKAAVWLAAQLASGLKDHTACNLCVVSDFNPRLQGEMRSWAREPNDDLAARATDTTRPVEERMLAAWLLGGSRRFPGVNIPQQNDRPRTALMRVMAESGMPLLLYYIADRVAVRTGDSMYVSVLPIWQMLQAAPDADVQVVRDRPPPGPVFGPILASAYDCHTREGRAALRRFAEVDEIRTALAPIRTPAERERALWSAVFNAEGARLDQRICTLAMDAVHRAAGVMELEYRGLKTRDQQGALLAAVLEHLPELHRIRAEIHRAAHPNDALDEGFRLARQPACRIQTPSIPATPLFPVRELSGALSAPLAEHLLDHGLGQAGEGEGDISGSRSGAE